MGSETSICNMALMHIGADQEIANVETEDSDAAAVCRRFFATARDKVLRDFKWPFATRTVTLALVETDPTEEWAFAYRLPPDSLQARRIQSGIRNDNRQTRVPYLLGSDDQGLLIYTDREAAILEYTAREENVNRFMPDFVVAFSYYLAFLITPSLTKGDIFKTQRQNWQLYRMEITKAQANAANEEQQEELPQSQMIRTREDDDGLPPNPFLGGM